MVFFASSRLGVFALSSGGPPAGAGTEKHSTQRREGAKTQRGEKEEGKIGVLGTALLQVECNRIQREGVGEGLKEAKGGNGSEKQVCIPARDARKAKKQ